MPADVVMLPGADRPEDAMKFIAEALARAEKPHGIVVAILEDRSDDDPDGVDVRIFGDAKRMELAYVGGLITYTGVAE